MLHKVSIYCTNLSHFVLFFFLPLVGSEVETRIKESTLRLKFVLLDSLKKDPPEAETGRSSYIIGFMSLEFLRIFKNSRQSDQKSLLTQRSAF